jgi:hypothetical protein
MLGRMSMAIQEATNGSSNRTTEQQHNNNNNRTTTTTTTEQQQVSQQSKAIQRAAATNPGSSKRCLPSISGRGSSSALLVSSLASMAERSGHEAVAMICVMRPFRTTIATSCSAAPRATRTECSTNDVVDEALHAVASDSKSIELVQMLPSCAEADQESKRGVGGCDEERG